MKKILILFGMIFFGTFAMANEPENIIQILPTEIKLGIPDDGEEVLEFSMNNSEPVWGLQFQLYLPEGLTLQEDPFEHEDERCPKPKRGNYYHSFDYNYKDGRYIVALSPNGDNYLTGNDGVVFYAYYTSDADIAPGVYPVVMKDIRIIFENTKVVIPEAVSYVTVGTPAPNTVYNLGNDVAIPSFVEEKLDNLNNVIINGVCENLVLTDGNDLSVPSNFTVTNATYSRSMDSEWGTICLPYEVQSNDNVAYYHILGVENNVLTLEPYATLPANTPALMQKISGSSVTCSATNVEIIADGDLNGTGIVAMYGSYANDTKVTDANAYYIKNNKFWLNNEYFFIDAFRAYFTYAPVGGAKASVLSLGDVPTAINSLTSNEGVAGVYDANGVKKGSVGNGMNIIKMADGKCVKVYVK